MLGADRAFAVGPTVPIASSVVGSFEWSPNGRHLLYFRSDLTFEDILADPREPRSESKSYEVALYDRVTRRTTVILSKVSEANTLPVQWLGKTNLLITQSGEARIGERTLRPLLLIDVVSGVRQAIVLSDATSMTVDGSPSQSRALAMYETVDGEFRYRVIESNGVTGMGGKLPARGIVIRWTSDGKNPVLLLLDAQPARQLVLNLATGKLTPIEPPKGTATEAASQPLTLSSNIETRVVKLVANPSPKDASSATYLLSNDSVLAALAPDLGAVALEFRGSLVIRHIKEVPHDMAVSLVAEQRKQAVITQSKYVALSVILFAADHDDRLPSPEMFQDRVMPYLKDRNMIHGFVYTFSGGSLSAIPDPATTQIGFVPGPGGRAVAFADGSVKWIPD